MKDIFKIFWNATNRLVYDGGLANAASVALSLLLSLFPFLLVIAILADIWGDPKLLEQIIQLVFSHWPAGTAAPIASQIKIVLGQARGEIFSFGTLIALVLATNGVESLRDGLNRAYKFIETRSFFVRRVQGTFFILVAALGLILAAFILVGTPVLWRFLLERIPAIADFAVLTGVTQYGLAAILLLLTLLSFHYFLPDGRLSLRDLIWGIIVTIVGIFVGSKLFAIYLTGFANYTAIYAGLAGVMVAIIYLYCLSILILFGAEFNAALKRQRSEN